MTGKLLLLVGLIALGLVSGIGVASWVQLTGRGISGAVHVSLPPTSSTFDPQQITSPLDISARTVTSLVFEGLLRYDWDGQVVPGVAESFPSSNDDGTLYTFLLRDNAAWSDGTTVTAEDFIRSAKTLLLGESPVGRLFHNLLGAESFIQDGLIDADIPGLESPSPDTLIIRLENPQPSFLDLLTLPAFYPTHPQSTGEFTSSSTAGLYNGAYVIEENLGIQVNLVRNEFYWGPKPRFPKLVLKFTDDPQVRYDQYRDGSLDLTEVRITPNTLPDELESRYFQGLEDGTIALIFRVDQPPFDNPDMRRAIALAIDRQRFVSIELDQKGRIAPTWIPPAIPGYREESPAAQEFDALRAREFLSSVERPVTRLTFQIEDTELGATIGKFVSSQLASNLGIEVEVEPIPSDTYRSYLEEGRISFSYVYWRSSYLDPANWLRDVFHSRGVFNYTGYDNPALDDILDGALSSNDPLEGPRLWNQAHDIVLSDAAIIPIAHPKRVVLVNSALGRLRLGPIDGGFPGSLSIRDNETE